MQFDLFSSKDYESLIKEPRSLQAWRNLPVQPQPTDMYEFYSSFYLKNEDAIIYRFYVQYRD